MLQVHSPKGSIFGGIVIEWKSIDADESDLNDPPVCMCVCILHVCMSLHHMHTETRGGHWLELQMIVSSHLHAGSQPPISGRAALNYRAISPASKLGFLFFSFFFFFKKRV